jgi:Transcriptional regulatory protein, C terminal
VIIPGPSEVVITDKASRDGWLIPATWPKLAPQSRAKDTAASGHCGRVAGGRLIPDFCAFRVRFPLRLDGVGYKRCLLTRTRTLNSHVSRLRLKLEQTPEDLFVVNVWGVGYKLVDSSP